MAEELDKETIEGLDNLFNAWLIENHMLSKGGVIYEGTAEGQIKEDNNGNPVRVNPETLRSKINNSVDGFAQYVQQQNPSIRITLEEQPFPE